MADEKQEFITKEQRSVAEGLVDFVNASPSPFHAVAACVEKLEKAGFTKLDETDTSKDWSGLKAGSYYFTRNQSTVFAFIKPQKWKPGNGFTIVGAHTVCYWNVSILYSLLHWYGLSQDSPCFRVKPISKKNKEKYLMCGVESECPRDNVSAFILAHKTPYVIFYSFLCIYAEYGGGLWHTWYAFTMSQCSGRGRA